MTAARRGKKDSAGTSCHALLARRSWKPLPSVVVLTGDAPYLKELVMRRFTKELFGEASAEVRRFQGPPNDKSLGELPLSTVLDELRTPSFLAESRLVIVDPATTFLKAHQEALTPFVSSGFAGGHLLLAVEGNFDRRRKFARGVAEQGWIVHCPQPYDRPPPWDTRTPIHDSELSHWLVRHAEAKGLELELETAFHLHERVGTDLAVLDEELEKIATYLAGKGTRRVDVEVVSSVCGELREGSIFSVVDTLLEGRRSEALQGIERLFERGYHNDRGALVLDPAGVALPFLGALLSKLRSLRRAHAMRQKGGSAEEWVAAGLIQKPFLNRFQRQLKATSAKEIERLLDRIYLVDGSIKRGGNPRRYVVLLVAECGS